MKHKKILKDILKLHPELEQDKTLLKKTVKFLASFQPEVSIDEKFKTDLGNRLATLAGVKSDSIKGLEKKPGFLHIFGGVFASLLAFFGLFYVFGDTLFYVGETPGVSEYETQFSDIDIIQQTKPEINSTRNISEPSIGPEEGESIESQETEIPNTVIINSDGASQIDVSQPEKIQVEKPTIKQIEPKESVEIILESEEKQSPVGDVQSDIIESIPVKQVEEVEPSGETDDTIITPIAQPDIGESLSDQNLDFGAIETTNPESSFSSRDAIESDTGFNPAAGSMMVPEIFSSDEQIQDTPDATENLADVEQESYNEPGDEFTLRCDMFGGEVSITDEIRVCNIGDIVCNETDFLKGVCELGE